MTAERYDIRKQFETGVVILSLDTEQIWGYLDQMNETQFCKQYPDALDAQDKVLACMTNAGVSATWFVVGGMALRGSAGRHDFRMAGLPVGLDHSDSGRNRSDNTAVVPALLRGTSA